MLKLFELFEFLYAPSFVWAYLIIKDHFVYFCSQIAFLFLAPATSVGCDLSQGSFSRNLIGSMGIARDIFEFCERIIKDDIFFHFKHMRLGSISFSFLHCD
jgi:hypothetical protein